jgi:hypothetical protein
MTNSGTFQIDMERDLRAKLHASCDLPAHMLTKEHL